MEKGRIGLQFLAGECRITGFRFLDSVINEVMDNRTQSQCEALTLVDTARV
ncbi:MAG: hypothetical protein OET90_05200 [Desulfuromonadales bacterium]|nr:hypothetical protein [Desulfuromonadales bacterium]